jgi:hypothetical protein
MWPNVFVSECLLADVPRKTNSVELNNCKIFVTILGDRTQVTDNIMHGNFTIKN